MAKKRRTRKALGQVKKIKVPKPRTPQPIGPSRIVQDIRAAKKALGKMTPDNPLTQAARLTEPLNALSPRAVLDALERQRARNTLTPSPALQSSLTAREKRAVCKERPNSAKATKGKGGSKPFVPWCDRK